MLGALPWRQKYPSGGNCFPCNPWKKGMLGKPIPLAVHSFYSHRWAGLFTLQHRASPGIRRNIYCRKFIADTEISIDSLISLIRWFLVFFFPDFVTAGNFMPSVLTFLEKVLFGCAVGVRCEWNWRGLHLMRKVIGRLGHVFDVDSVEFMVGF